jgi:hypothetical protein
MVSSALNTNQTAATDLGASAGLAEEGISAKNT